MRRVLLPVGVCALLLVLAGLAVLRPDAPAPAPKQARNPDGLPIGLSFGDRLVQMSSAELSQALGDVVRLGGNWIRMDLSWATLQPHSAEEWSWDGVDRVVAAARARKLKVLGILTYTPGWARDPGCEEGIGCPPAHTVQFVRFAARVAKRYAGRVAAYEIWNEPNLGRFFAGTDPHRYASLLGRTAAQVRHEDPGAKILFGGLASRNAIEYTREVCATHACRGLDGLAYHPYTYPQTANARSGTPSAWQRITEPYDDVPSLRSVARAAGLSRIWITEYGAPTGGRPGEHYVDEVQQAQIIASGIREVRRNPQLYGGIWIYSWRDLGPAGTTENHFGILRPDGTRKPAFAAMAHAINP